MEVKPGYKQTEVGVIPKEWEVEACGKLCAKIQDGTHFSPKIRGNDYLYLTSKNVRFGYLDISTADRIDAAQHEAIYKRCDVKHGDLLLTKDGANTGNAAINTLSEQFSLLSSVALLRFDPKQHSATYFLQQCLSAEGQQRMKDAMSGNAITRLTLEKIRKLQFPVAPLPEQRAIATALSDVDGLLGGLERLIAKKRDLKQAAMQQLLTAQTRLPGFHGEWQVKRLSDLIEEIGDGGTPSTGNPNNFGGQINWAVIDDIKPDITTTATTLTEAGLKACAAKLWNPGTLIVSTGATIGEVGITRIPVATKQGICGIVVDQDEADTIFIKYWFVQNKPLVLSKAQGSTIKEVRAPTLVQLEIRVPPLPEQTAIAEVLSEMDGELAALEERREKTRALKQSMMQALLTGRTRLL